MTGGRVMSPFPAFLASIAGAVGHVVPAMMAFEAAGRSHIIGVEWIMMRRRRRRRGSKVDNLVRSRG
jgi:hypothetical protein